MINKSYLTVTMLLGILIMHQANAMDEAPKSKGTLLREAIREELPKIVGKGTIETGTFDMLIRYSDNNFIEKFIELLGQTTTTLDERNNIFKGIPVRTGHWYLDDRWNHVSTGNVIECIAIVVQHENPALIAMYHYFQKADKNFEQLDTFLNAINNKATELSINLSDCKVSLISSYMSPNYVIIKRAMEKYGFTVTLQHIRHHAYLSKNHYVRCDTTTTPPGRLIVASPSELKVYYDDGYDSRYDSDLPVDPDDCIIM